MANNFGKQVFEKPHHRKGGKKTKGLAFLVWTKVEERFLRFIF
jgi:hypothetical protein